MSQDISRSYEPHEETFTVVLGMRCNDRRFQGQQIHIVEHVCPFCGATGYTQLSKSVSDAAGVYRYVSVECEADGKVFLVEWPL